MRILLVKRQMAKPDIDDALHSPVYCRQFLPFRSLLDHSTHHSANTVFAKPSGLTLSGLRHFRLS
jgi:hypothetical protein